MVPPFRAWPATVVALALWTVAAFASHVQWGDTDHRSSSRNGGASRILEREEKRERDSETIVVREGIVFQVITEVEAIRRADDPNMPGNVIRLISDGPGRAGNHFLTISAYMSMAYCCKSKVLELPQYDETIPALSKDGKFVSSHRFFDFSGVDTVTPDNFEGISENSKVCPQYFTEEGIRAFRLVGIHPELLSCMNNVYLRGCEALYLEPLLGSSDFCEKPPANERRFLRESDLKGYEEHIPEKTSLLTGASMKYSATKEKEYADIADAVLSNRRGLGGGGRGGYYQRPYPGVKIRNLGGPDASFRGGAEGSAGSLVIHIRSGDIFLPRNAKIMEPNFAGFGQPPLQFYLWAIASQRWSDVSIITFSPNSKELNPAFAALEMMQLSGLLGPNVDVHKNRDLLTDIQAMLCADGLAISRSTLHFLTFAHSRATHYFVPSACGPGTYTRKTRRSNDGTKKPNPNNTTLLCIERPGAEVYGVVWEEDEDAYGLYNGWQDTEKQLLDMLLFDGVKGLDRCCEQ